jgi:ubiquinone/menaquinone biosynthesis C-methylase UbiE
MNYFEGRRAAQLYAQHRPYYHPVVVERIRLAFATEDYLESVLDVGCGTGHSSRALVAIAQRVVGLDLSHEMLAQATPHPKIRYVQGRAEEMDFPDDSFDLVTVSGAFHWLDRERFLPQAYRVLRSKGRMVIYNNFFKAKMKENTLFDLWFHSAYLKRFPTPPRNTRPFTNEEALMFGFQFLHRDTYENEVGFTSEKLVNYLMTHTNVIAALEEGKENFEEVRHWLEESVRSFFTSEEGTFLFGGPIWFLRRE